MSVHACVFRHHRTFANDPLAIGLDELTGETLFRDDRSSVAVEEFLGNISTVAWLKKTLEAAAGNTSRNIQNTFLIGGSHCGDVIAKSEVALIALDANRLLAQSQGLDSQVVDFLNGVLRLCAASLQEDNPIVFV